MVELYSIIYIYEVGGSSHVAEADESTKAQRGEMDGPLGC